MAMLCLTGLLTRMVSVPWYFHTGFIAFVLLAMYATMKTALKCVPAAMTSIWVILLMGNFVVCAITAKLHGVRNFVTAVIQDCQGLREGFTEAKIQLALLVGRVSTNADTSVARLGKLLRCMTVLLFRFVLPTAFILISGLSLVYAQDRVLVPWNTISGGRLASQVDRSGYPLTSDLQDFHPFVYPAFLAVRGQDFLIADSGARKIYRYDLEQQVLSIVPGISASVRTRMQIGQDQTLFVLDAGDSTVLHFNRGGQLLDSYSDPRNGFKLEDFIVMGHSGHILAIDRKNNGLVAVNSGWAKIPLSTAAVGATMKLGALANAGGGDIFAIESNCSCVVVLDEDGRVHQQLGVGVLVQPYSVAADRQGYVFVADAANQKLWVFLRGKQIASYEARKLHVNEISAMAVDEGVLYIADGPGGQVVTFHVRPPMERRQ